MKKTAPHLQSFFCRCPLRTSLHCTSTTLVLLGQKPLQRLLILI